MTMTVSQLAAMTGDEFEAHRSAGYTHRQELTHAVMRALPLPEDWAMNGEYRAEFGGLFPVQVRFSPEHGQFHVVICSPGEVSECWLVLVVACQGSRVTCVRQQSRFDADEFSRVLTLISALDRDGYRHPHILSMLKEGVPA